MIQDFENSQSLRRVAFSIALLLCVSLVLASCGKRVFPSTGGIAESSWPQHYNDAVTDALNPEPGEIVHNLVAITRQTPDLQWNNISGTAHVLMVSLVGNTSYYEDSLGYSYSTGDHDIWVTAPHEMKQTCGAFDLRGDNLKMRLRELLGLVPDAEVKAFVEFWVKPADLFRPAADNEIYDTTAGLKLPDDTPPWYRKWFNELRAVQYVQCKAKGHNAYPWTQLGYTYDWGNLDSEQGLSEFVIKKNSRVVIRSIRPFEAYCR